MNERSNLPIEVLANLAREYQTKHRELEEVIQNTPPEKIPLQLKALAERATDRFRSAQMQLTGQLATSPLPDIEGDLQVLTVLFRCFDEMRIILQMLLEHYPQRHVRD